MRKRSITAIVLTAAMTAGMISGCGSSSSASSGASAAASSGASATSTDPITLTFYNADGSEDNWDDPVAQAITAATGVTLETDYPASSDDEKIALMIADGKYPDLIYAKGDAQSLIDAGALIDMSDLIDKYGPNIRKLYGDEFDKLKYSEDDPSIYQLSSYSVGGTSYESSGTAQMQWRVLSANDYKYPTSLDEFEQMLKDYIAANPQTDGLDNIGLSMCASDWHWMITLGNPSAYIACGAPDNGEWLIDDDDDYKVTYKYKNDDVRAYFKWLNKLYNEGLLDPEFATQTYEDYIAKISSGRVLALTDTDWDYSDGEKVLLADGKTDETYAGLPFTASPDIKCASLMYQGLTTGQGVGITTDCKDPVRAIRFLDYLCSDEGQVLINWGIEGTNYFYDDNGVRYRTEEEIEKANSDADYAKTTGVGFHAYPFPCYGTGVKDENGSTYKPTNADTVKDTYNDEEKKACEAWNVDLLTDIFPQADEFKVPEYSPTWAYTMSSDYNEIATQLSEIAQSSLVSCVTCSADQFDSTYDDMLSQFDGVGVSTAEDLLHDMVKSRVAVAES